MLPQSSIMNLHSVFIQYKCSELILYMYCDHYHRWPTLLGLHFFLADPWLPSSIYNWLVWFWLQWDVEGLTWLTLALACQRHRDTHLLVQHLSIPRYLIRLVCKSYTDPTGHLVEQSYACFFVPHEYAAASSLVWMLLCVCCFQHRTFYWRRFQLLSITSLSRYIMMLNYRPAQCVTKFTNLPSKYGYCQNGQLLTITM